jgi:hypothetical protein
MKRRIRRRDSIYTHEEYVTHIERSSHTGRLSAEEVKTEQIINYKNWWSYFLIILLHRRDFKVSLKFCICNEFRHDSVYPGVPGVCPFVNTLISEQLSLSRHYSTSSWNLKRIISERMLKTFQ